jgi:hypothetical protein
VRVGRGKDELRRRRASCPLAGALTACLAAFGVLAAPAAAEAKPLRIKTLSNRADLISAGDALVQVKGTGARRTRITLNGGDVTSAFAVRPDGRFTGLVTGLRDGRNVIRAKRGNGSGARLVIRNHPNGGPVFSGPQVQPWVCQETAVDAQCNQPVEYTFQYKSATTGQLLPYDPESPPPDVATTTTDQGVEVPFIIRTETGYQDRDQYKIAVLYDPSKPWAAWEPQPQWNHKLLITHGQSCAIDHQAGEAPSVTRDIAGQSPEVALGRGFAVMSTALDHAGHNCNIITQAESLVMAKERLREQYGPIRYTIGTGCSGGSLTQQQVANAYPGIYQGILPQCSFPDAWTTGQQLVDYHLTRLYTENPSKWGLGVVWTPAEIAALEGHPNHVNAIILDSLYWTSLGDPTSECAGVTDEQRYDPDTNPTGVRCTLADYMINVFGPRDPSVWTEVERRIGRGFAGLPLDNVGVQYGLEALRSGQIRPEQFVDLNEKIGGGDIDINPRPERLVADQPALRNAYRSGAVNSANNLDRVAIIDLRGPDHGAFHDAYRTWATRARMEREQGAFPRNHVIWMGHAPLIGDLGYTTEGLLAMDRWLAAVEKDESGASRAEKVVRNRPEDIVDRCSNIDGVDRVAVPGVGQVCSLRDVESRYGTPRTVAGESVATDTNKCALKPHRRSDYYPVEFTDDQWARLERAFPTGVCDWSRPGVDQGDTVGWMTYEGAVGGRPLGPAPKSRRVRARRP